MNSLSWTLYVADLLGSLKIALILSAIASGPVAFFITAAQRDLSSRNDAWPWPKRLFVASGVFAFLAVAVPSSQTVYMIAASEAGERAIQTPAAREMLDLIRGKLREILTDKA